MFGAQLAAGTALNEWKAWSCSIWIKHEPNIGKKCSCAEVTLAGHGPAPAAAWAHAFLPDYPPDSVANPNIYFVKPQSMKLQVLLFLEELTELQKGEWDAKKNMGSGTAQPRAEI